jgi:hypothetical protein
MEFIIDLWVSIPYSIRDPLIWAITLSLPAIFVIFVKLKWLGYTLGTLFFMLPGLLSSYALCSREIIFCSPGDNKEIGPYLLWFFTGFIYCLLIEFIMWMIKTLRDYK